MAKKLGIKIIGISGSSREGSTLNMMRAVLEATGQDHELIMLKDKKINPCRACGGCFYSHKCTVNDDMQELYEKLAQAEIIVLGSPTYFGNVTGPMKDFIDRCLPLYLAEKLKGKKAALVSAGNFKKGEVRFLDGFDIEAAMKDPVQRKELEKPVKNCIAIMKSFCQEHMMMEVVGSVMAINGGQEPKKQRLTNLGKKLIS